MRGPRLLLFLILFNLSAVVRASADDTAIKYIGGRIVPMDEHRSVVLVSEHVRARVFRKHSLVECVFFLRNEGSETSVEIGFPCHASEDFMRAGFEFFESFVDGKRVEVEIVEPGEDSGPSPRVWYVKRINFLDGELKAVRNIYKGGYGFDTDQNIWFEYVLETGSSWRGGIESANIVVSLEDFGLDQLTRIEPDGYEMSGTEIRWTFSQFEPESNIRIGWKHNAETGIVSGLHRLAALGDIEGVSRILECGVDIDSLSAADARYTPLRCAIRYGACGDIVAFLINRGADPNLGLRWNKPLLTAINFRNDSTTDVVRILLEKGARILPNTLSIAMGSDCPPGVIELLIAGGADVNHAGSTGLTPLHHGCLYGVSHVVPTREEAYGLALEKIRVLLEHGADPNVRDERGNAPLDYAETDEIRELLISCGARRGESE